MPGSDMETIHLHREDDIVSMCDHLEWVSGAQRVLLVLPADGELLREWLDLVRLHRCARRLRLEVGLVSPDPVVAAQAKALGIPTFSSVAKGEENRRGWWRGREGGRKPTLPGAGVQLGEFGDLKLLPDEADRREIYRRMTPRPSWQRWLLRYAGIVIFVSALATFLVAVAYAVPGATVTLHPEVDTLQVSLQVVADPQLETVNYSGASVPGRLLAVTVSWEAEVATTGRVDVPDVPARGKVVFVNRTEQPVTVPAGARVSTTAGNSIVFQTLEAIELPDVAGGTAEGEVVALEPGPEGNVAPNQINRVEGSLAARVLVRNLEAMSGGGSRSAPAVSELDQERLRSQVLQQLQTIAAAEMTGLLGPDEFLARDSLRVAEIYQETFSHFPGELGSGLALEIRAEVQGTTVDATQTYDLVYQELAAAVPTGYELIPASMRFTPGELLGADAQGRVTFNMVGEARIAAEIAEEAFIARVAGQETEAARSYLFEQLPLRQPPTVSIWPDWFGRLPYLQARIRTVLDSG